MKPVFLWVVLCCACGLRVLAGDAAALSKLTDAERQQVNEWMAQRATVMIDASKIEDDVGNAWSNTAYTSPEVDALRVRYRELQQELARTQREIQKKAEEIPAIQAKRRQLDELKSHELELKKKIVEKVGE